MAGQACQAPPPPAPRPGRAGGRRRRHLMYHTWITPDVPYMNHTSCTIHESHLYIYGIRYTVYGIRYTVYGIRYTGIRYTGIRVYGYTVYGIRYTVNFPFLQKMKVLRIAQPSRQNLNWVRPSILQPIIRPLLPYRVKIQILIGIRVLFNSSY